MPAERAPGFRRAVSRFSRESDRDRGASQARPRRAMRLSQPTGLQLFAGNRNSTGCSIANATRRRGCVTPAPHIKRNKVITASSTCDATWVPESAACCRESNRSTGCADCACRSPGSLITGPPGSITIVNLTRPVWITHTYRASGLVEFNMPAPNQTAPRCPEARACLRQPLPDGTPSWHTKMTLSESLPSTSRRPDSRHQPANRYVFSISQKKLQPPKFTDLTDDILRPASPQCRQALPMTIPAMKTNTPPTTI